MITSSTSSIFATQESRVWGGLVASRTCYLHGNTTAVAGRAAACFRACRPAPRPSLIPKRPTFLPHPPSLACQLTCPHFVHFATANPLIPHCPHSVALPCYFMRPPTFAPQLGLLLCCPSCILGVRRPFAARRSHFYSEWTLNASSQHCFGGLMGGLLLLSGCFNEHAHT
jgi:hypothetical protein